MANIKKIVKNLGGIVASEVKRIEDCYQQGIEQQYRPHPVKVGSDRYISHDAKKLNLALNQSGRGDFRYLSSPDTKSWYLAEHRSAGKGYRVLGAL